jgi:hypothetical protein
MLNQEVTTVNISTNGALLKSVRGNLQRGAQVSLSRLGKTEAFHVAWLGKDKTHAAGQMGGSSVAPVTSLWNDLLKRHSDDTSFRPGTNGSEESLEDSEVMAHAG